MKSPSRWMLLIVAAAPLLTAALWMDNQPVYKPFRSPALPKPEGSVPVTGTEGSEPLSGQKNPVPASESSLAQGKVLFEINCAMCHGPTSAKRGPVGLKLNPPPPALDHEMVQALDDSVIFNAVTAGFGRMPAFRSKLTIEERWHLINYLRTRQ
ncbi:cytochrome c [Geomonas sp.]|uniref:c-type cytochrome n=1 Tax=Geomonas sp. TaxID=2651584 RepID=UPI002B48BCFC|nr:cytochrome c [Geomonas sp.]HJV33459.1 cytochrome c [Geomonas sp.]